MKIKYDLTNERFKFFNFAYGISRRKWILKKHPNKKIFKMTTIGIIYLNLLIILLFVGAGFIGIFSSKQYIDIHIDILSNIIYLLFALIILDIFTFIGQYIFIRKKISKGLLVIDKDGVSDISDDKTTIKIGWDNVDLIVINDNYMVIISKLFLISSKTQDKDKLINTIKKYNNEGLLIVR